MLDNTFLFSSAFPLFTLLEAGLPLRLFPASSFWSLASCGGDEEDRTPDPLRARQVLSQLSYTPVFQGLGLPLHLFKILFRTFKIEQ